ncbi:MAG: DUF2093 domain-containing protein [Pseudomonadota bacterium]
MNIFDSGSGEAELAYLDADYEVVRPGSYVLCAVTGVKIPLASLKYWNVDKQEAYADANAAAVGFGLISGS